VSNQLYILRLSMHPVYYTYDVNEAKSMAREFATALHGNSVAEKETDELLYISSTDAVLGEYVTAAVSPVVISNRELFDMWMNGVTTNKQKVN